MAKKVVATLSRGKGSKFTKLIQAQRSPKTGAYVFRSKIIPSEMTKEALTKKS